VEEISRNTNWSLHIKPVLKTTIALLKYTKFYLGVKKYLRPFICTEVTFGSVASGRIELEISVY
jgi:hypothetical protein